MDDYEQQVRKLQEEAMAALQKEMEASTADPLHYEKTKFLMEFIYARHAKRLSQAELAKRVHTQQSVIARLESGRGNPSLRTLLTIAKALDVHIVLE